MFLEWNPPSTTTSSYMTPFPQQGDQSCVGLAKDFGRLRNRRVALFTEWFLPDCSLLSGAWLEGGREGGRGPFMHQPPALTQRGKPPVALVCLNHELGRPTMGTSIRRGTHVAVQSNTILHHPEQNHEDNVILKKETFSAETTQWISERHAQKKQRGKPY